MKAGTQSNKSAAAKENMEAKRKEDKAKEDEKQKEKEEEDAEVGDAMLKPIGKQPSVYIPKEISKWQFIRQSYNKPYLLEVTKR